MNIATAAPTFPTIPTQPVAEKKPNPVVVPRANQYLGARRIVKGARLPDTSVSETPASLINTFAGDGASTKTGTERHPGLTKEEFEEL